VPTLAQRQRHADQRVPKGVGRIGVVMPGTTVHCAQGRPRVVEDDVVATGAHVDLGLQRRTPGKRIGAGRGKRQPDRARSVPDSRPHVIGREIEIRPGGGQPTRRNSARQPDRTPRSPTDFPLSARRRAISMERDASRYCARQDRRSRGWARTSSPHADRATRQGVGQTHNRCLSQQAVAGIRRLPCAAVD